MQQNTVIILSLEEIDSAPKMAYNDIKKLKTERGKQNGQK